MDNVAVSKRNHTFKKANKENTESSNGSKCSIRRDKTSAAPFKVTNIKNEDTMAKNGPLKAKADPQSTSGEAEKRGKTVQKEAKGVAASVKLHQTHSRAFLCQQTVKHKVVAEAPKPPAAGPPSKSALGMYKGKIVQSKIGSIWKPTAGGADLKTGDRNEMRRRSKSIAEMPGHGAQKPFQTSSKSVMDGTAQVTKPAVVSRPAGVQSARRPASAVSETLASCRNANVAPVQRGGTHRSQPKSLATNKQVNKPPVSSTLSQYRFTMENAEERRAKLADWLASKGKTFKRPPSTAAEPSKTRVPAKAKVQSQTPEIMNTPLELLENSDIEQQDSVDDIVVNLCDVLEALVTPSRCDELSKMTNVGSNVQLEDSKPHSECKVEGVQQKMSENVAQVKDEVEESEEGELDDECVMVTTPKTADASVIKYSVKTTPYLQSVKRTIEEEASTSRCRRKSNIKDLKFLTPVRRSCRIERNASRLPPMLVDPDPCVSSLAELLKLDDHPNAYIYRKNHALLEEQPDSVNV
ncbi:cytoskeleton-associated protein 2 [Pungitius pungitius]|uniref:cytoskeleton-associated protein 2 n=1 Tax=Pungitius pungitius TaxID=134920 RepID=UPI002E105215